MAADPAAGAANLYAAAFIDLRAADLSPPHSLLVGGSIVLCPEQALIKCKQRLVDFKDIIVSALYEIFDDDVKFV